MSVKPFLDTNILVYAFAANDRRSDTAEALLAAGGVVSVQVLNEFVNVSRRKLGLEWSEIRKALTILRALLDPPQPLTVELHEAAIDIAHRYGFHFYDSLILAAALQAGCDVLYSEDLQSRQRVDRLTVRNPFS